MDSLQATYKDEEEEEDEAPPLTTTTNAAETAVANGFAAGGGTDTESAEALPVTTSTASDTPTEALIDVKTEPDLSDASDDGSGPTKSPKSAGGVGGNDEEDDEPPPKKQKQLSSLTADPGKEDSSPAEALPDGNNNGDVIVLATTPATSTGTGTHSKKSKKKSNNVWSTKSKKTKKKSKGNNNNNNNGSNHNNNNHPNGEDTVLITPVPRFPDKSDDKPEMDICLSKVYKAEKVELSEDRLVAGSTKGYRMVRATRAVAEGAWYFEIRILNLGETGHTRLGWSNEKGDLQAPVGNDGNSYGYRDIDGSKVHKAWREKYGEEGYKEGDVIGFYINLPDGKKYAPKAPHLVWYKGQRYAAGQDPKQDPPKIVPGSEISFFRNGLCQGVAFKDIYGGHYYPAASMYTLPNEPNCTVKFNFGPDFEFFPENFHGQPIPKPMIEVPYIDYDNLVKNGETNEKEESNEKKSLK